MSIPDLSARPGEGALVERLDLAKYFYQEFYASCFWHLRPDLEITAQTLPLVIRGLRQHGGRRGYLAVARLLAAPLRDAPCP